MTPPSSYSARFADALALATSLHDGQVRKGSGVPYITHLLGVAALVGDHGGDEDQVIAGLLHDAIEDGVKDRPDIATHIGERFGPRVLTLVRACSDTETHPKPPWAERKRAYVAHVERAPDEDPALLVSAADKLYNARTLLRDLNVVGHALWDRFKATRPQTLWYYRALADAYTAKRWPTPTQTQLAAELARVVARLEARAAEPSQDQED